MPGTGDLQDPGPRVDLGVQAGREAHLGRVLADAVQEPGGAREHGVRPVALRGVRPQRYPQLAHQPCGPYVVALYVADDQREPASPDVVREAPPGSGITSYQSPPTWSPPPVGT